MLTTRPRCPVRSTSKRCPGRSSLRSGLMRWQACLNRAVAHECLSLLLVPVCLQRLCAAAAFSGAPPTGSRRTSRSARRPRRATRSQRSPASATRPMQSSGPGGPRCSGLGAEGCTHFPAEGSLPIAAAACPGAKVPGEPAPRGLACELWRHQSVVAPTGRRGRRRDRRRVCAAQPARHLRGRGAGRLHRIRHALGASCGASTCARRAVGLDLAGCGVLASRLCHDAWRQPLSSLRRLGPARAPPLRPVRVGFGTTPVVT